MSYPSDVVVGIDGATFDLIRPWVDEGKLPNFEQFLEDGVTSELTTTYPPLTAPAWVSFMTGCNPGKHGVYDFLKSDPESEEVVNYSSIQSPTLWEMLNSKSRRCGLVNVPVTYPPPDIDGHVISGTLSSSDPRESCTPSSLIEELEEKTGTNWWHRESFNFAPSKPLEYFEGHLDYNKKLAKYSLTMLEEYEYDFFMVLLDIVDSISHFFWHYMDEEHPYHENRGEEYSEAILRAYQFVDGFLGDLDELLPADTNVVLMSDHGFGPIDTMVNLNNFFMDEDLLRLKKSPGTLLKRSLRGLGINPTRLVRIAEFLGLDKVASMLPKDLRNKIIGSMGSYSDINWLETVCYSRGHMGQVHLVDRLKGDPETYREARSRVAETLRNDLRDPETGEQLVTEIKFREEIYDGPYLEDAPDLFLVMKDFQCIAYPLFSGGSDLVIPHIQKGRYANHRMNGIFCGLGPAFRSGETLSEASITDLVPTLQFTQGVPVADHLDGEVLTGAFEESYRQGTELEYGSYEGSVPPSTGSPDEPDGGQDEAIERLEGLGYLG